MHPPSLYHCYFFILSSSCFLLISLISLTHFITQNGDLNWCLDGRFLAFAGPHAERQCSPGGYYNLRPEDSISYYKKRNVTLVVRLNKPYYDARKFTAQGIDHMELYFIGECAVLYCVYCVYAILAALSITRSHHSYATSLTNYLTSTITQTFIQSL